MLPGIIKVVPTAMQSWRMGVTLLKCIGMLFQVFSSYSAAHCLWGKQVVMLVYVALMNCHTHMY